MLAAGGTGAKSVSGPCGSGGNAVKDFVAESVRIRTLLRVRSEVLRLRLPGFRGARILHGVSPDCSPFPTNGQQCVSRAPTVREWLSGCCPIPDGRGSVHAMNNPALVSGARRSLRVLCVELTCQEGPWMNASAQTSRTGASKLPVRVARCQHPLFFGLPFHQRFRADRICPPVAISCSINPSARDIPCDSTSTMRADT